MIKHSTWKQNYYVQHIMANMATPFEFHTPPVEDLWNI